LISNQRDPGTVVSFAPVTVGKDVAGWTEHKNNSRMSLVGKMW